jgi:threonine dehydrogenase-like Zn-dependent dehydrogenase
MTSKTMKAAVFVEPGRIELREKPIPEIGPDDALVRVTTTTICGTDIHIRKGEYAVHLALPSVTSRSALSKNSALQ